MANIPEGIDAEQAAEARLKKQYDNDFDRQESFEEYKQLVLEYGDHGGAFKSLVEYYEQKDAEQDHFERVNAFLNENGIWSRELRREILYLDTGDEEVWKKVAREYLNKAADRLGK